MNSAAKSSTTATAISGSGLFSELPLMTLMLGGLCLMIGFASSMWPVLELLCFDHQAITQQYQYWRLLTGHFVHSSLDHLTWDLLAFVVAGSYLEIKNKQLYLRGLILGLLTLSAFLMTPLSSIQQYSGLSGIVYVLITLAVLIWAKGQQGWIGYLPLVVILVKTLLEITADTAVFMQQGWQVYYPAHLIGLACALFIYFYASLQSNNYTVKRPLT